MTNNREILEHKEWLGMLQPVGLIVSSLALTKHQAVLDRSRAIELQSKLAALVSTDQSIAYITDFPTFAQEILEWEITDLVGAPNQPPIPSELEIPLSDYGEILKPTYAIPEPGTKSWLMLIQILPTGLSLDNIDEANDKKGGWNASPQAKFERLLRETEIPIGLLCNGTEIRLVYAPRGESSGHLTFPVQAMTEVAGRPILAALDMLLGQDRLFTVPTEHRLPKILSDSRSYQAEVSTQLAGQVLDALWQLLTGFQEADTTAEKNLISQLAKTEPQHIYGGLITTLMRLVFLLYAEDRGLMPNDGVYQRCYAVSTLYHKLRLDNTDHPNEMESRHGAWASLLSLFRLVYDGGGSYEGYLPARHGQLFDPDEYPFLEGRTQGSHYRSDEDFYAPRISDGTIYRILDKLLILDGERLSYRALDVEQIGSVYEAIMGYEVKVAEGKSIALTPNNVVINLEALLATEPKKRASLLKEEAECNISGKSRTDLEAAKNVDDLLAALGKKTSRLTPNILPLGSLFLQPGDERRRTGSHYTPRKLTQPIVETTLRPQWERLGIKPTPEQILELKICDPAMGSAAFLVEACRQLADKLVEAWENHGLPADLSEAEPLLYARRLVAQRCLYGVDKNPFAVNLAKLSLWLVTLAKDLPFTFLDHAFKCGDSLVGLTRAEIGKFTKDPTEDLPLFRHLKEKVEQAKNYRAEIQAVDTRSDADAEQKRSQLLQAETELAEVRLIGDVQIAAFFHGKNERKDKKSEYAQLVREAKNAITEDPRLTNISQSLRSGVNPITPFNWELEFPEVFDRDNPGFDAIVGNPPFAGKNNVINSNPEGYLNWLQEIHPESHGNADLVAHFFRRAFDILRKDGSLGLIATNTIAQGDTRSSGLRFICHNEGTIYNAQKRLKWPGLAAVVVSVINIFKGKYQGKKTLDDRETDVITAFLFHAGGNNDPKPLLANQDKSFIGSYVLGMGFTFDDSNPEATPIAEMHRLIAKDARNGERIFPYIGGEEVNSSPTHAHHRYVINFGEMSEAEAREWPDLMAIVEEKVKPARLAQKREIRSRYWWRFGETTPALFRAIAQCDRVLAIPCGATVYVAFAFLPANMVFSHALAVFALEKYSAFAALQSQIHEIWARFFGSSLEDRLRYTPSDCFETFPFPENWESDPNLETIGQSYYEYRAELMVRNNQGLTDTYNRFHDPYETDPDILKLRELHEQMDRAVLQAYGWEDIDTTCGFALDYLDTESDELPPEVQERIATGDLFFATADEAIDFDSIARTGKRRLPWRYRWPETTHNEVLARLLQLNQLRYEAEELLGKRADNQGKKTPKKGKKPKSKPEANPQGILPLDL
ncbi:Eco57I restriction-modification methylase domain-containing protein [[Phormidium] sp. ETS-05]|uniref:Eco57I restriction-modification methylase domain-containing protein n=1 Tax=[Phormidium] sp. ETS-05 TaxID=222819 RepID=UPI0018EF056B|nr:DNA methyltransferase [[Phormidium] sp. ETS-05]